MGKKKGPIKSKHPKIKRKKSHAISRKKASKHSGDRKVDNVLNVVFDFFKEDKENLKKSQ